MDDDTTKLSDGGDEGELKRSLAQILSPRRDRNLDRPDIGHLEDAIALDPASGQPVLRVREGDRIVIERRTTVLKGPVLPWLDTRLWYVNGVDQERGTLKLYDEELQQHGTDSYTLGLRVGQLYKLPPRDGRRWDVAPRKKTSAPATAPDTSSPAAPSEPGKKRRGRPKGSKNRSRAEIAADKAQRAAVKAARVAVKRARFAAERGA